MFRNENKVALHCRKVLIDAEPKGLFLEWLRFLKGVVDSSDLLPERASLETMQMKHLRKLNQEASRDFMPLGRTSQEEENYLNFEGIAPIKEAATDFTLSGRLGLLFFESTALMPKIDRLGRLHRPHGQGPKEISSFRQKQGPLKQDLTSRQ